MFTINKELCTNCQECKDNCPSFAIEENGEMEVSINVSLCIDCALCQSICPFGAIEEKQEE